jgi:hypothetical protein
MLDLLWTFSGYAFLLAVYYAGIYYPIRWFRHRYTVRIARRRHATGRV